MRKWKTLDSKYIYKSNFGNLRRDTCELPGGQVIDNIYINEYTNWVNAIVITKEHQLVLVEQYRHGGQKSYLEIPAGKIEKHETAEQGMLRELREETGYASSEKPVLLGEYMVNPALQTNKIITFLITEAINVSGQKLDAGEDIQVKLIDFTEFGRLLKSGMVETQLFTAGAYYMALALLNE